MRDKAQENFLIRWMQLDLVKHTLMTVVPKTLLCTKIQHEMGLAPGLGQYGYRGKDTAAYNRCIVRTPVAWDRGIGAD